MAAASIARLRSVGGALAAVALLTACDRDVVLPGERFGTRVPLDETLPTDESGAVDAGESAAPISRAITLPPPVDVAAWPQRGANVQNAMPHAAMGAAPRPLFAVDIGSGNSRRARLTATPVALDGRIFTLDADAGLRAFSTGGGLLWAVDLTPAWERGGDVSGGALGAAGDTLYATTGYGELIALDVETGGIRWRQRLDAAIGAPTITEDTVYVVSRDGEAWAIEPENGRIRWVVTSEPAAALRVGGAAPAVTDRLVVFPFGTGELQGVLRQSGVRVWGTTVAGARPGVAYNFVSDITGDPVLVGDVLYAGNQSGRVVAMDAGSGERIWTARDGAYSPVLAAGGSLFFVSDRNELIRVDAATGERIWGVELPLYVTDRPRRRQAVFAHYGPILAGGRLVVASNDGAIRFFDPETGGALGTLPIRGGAAAMPIVVGGVLYVVSGDGTLNAYR